jgi:predicted RNA binding protein YcfA (HicA-like mRNA interferase family)
MDNTELVSLIISRHQKKSTYLYEKLTPQEAEYASTWKRDPKAVKATDHFFGKGNDEKHEELVGTVDKSEVHKAVERHLGHEIHPDDYRAGVTKDKYGRQVKIGGLLTKSKADPKLINGFANDNTRQGKKQTGLSVRITRSPEGVAGQTSHNQSWENQSCKNFNTGINRHYLKGEVKHGTVVAYLHNHKGEEIARTTLQPHINDEGHTAYAVDSHYGIDHAGFKKHVENLAKRLSGEHKGGSIIYKKHDKVYNDSGVKTMIQPNASKKHIDKALDDKDDYVRRVAASHPNATKEHLDKALNDKYISVREAAASHPNATKEHIDKALNDKDAYVRVAAAKNPNATKEHLDKALNDKDAYVRVAVARNPNATKEHIDKALNDKDTYVRVAAAKNPNATKEHLDKALNDKNSSVRVAVARNPNATKEHLDKALDDEDASVREAAASHPNATKEHLDKALNDDHYIVRQAAASHPNATSEHLDKAMKDTDPQVRRIAAEKMLDKLGEKKPMNESFNFTQTLDEKINPFDIGRSHRDVTKHMKKIGYVLHRDRGDHELYKHPNSPHTIAVPRHKDISPGVIRQVMAHIKTVQESVDESKRGLWYNIKKRREAGKRMRKPGEPGAPTAEAIRNSQTKEHTTLDTIKRVISESAAWQRKEGKNPKGGLNQKGVNSYKKEHPGSHLQTAVTTEPSKLKPGSKAANRRKSFCARMGGMPGPMKDEHGKPTRKALSLRKWNC